MIGEVMRQGFLTVYRGELGGKYSSEITARSWRHAEALARRRGLGEKVIGEGRLHSRRPASVVLRATKTGLPEKLHALCWLARLALAAKVAKPEDFLADDVGLIHQLAHLYSGSIEAGEDVMGYRSKVSLLRALAKKAAAIERRVPGYLE